MNTNLQKIKPLKELSNESLRDNENKTIDSSPMEEDVANIDDLSTLEAKTIDSSPLEEEDVVNINDLSTLEAKTIDSSPMEEEDVANIDDLSTLEASSPDVSIFTVENSAEYIGPENKTNTITGEIFASTSTSSAIILPQSVGLEFAENVEHEIFYISDDNNITEEFDTDVVRVRPRRVRIKQHIAVNVSTSSDKIVNIDQITPGFPSNQRPFSVNKCSSSNETDMVLDTPQSTTLDNNDAIKQDSDLNDNEGTIEPKEASLNDESTIEDPIEQNTPQGPYV